MFRLRTGPDYLTPLSPHETLVLVALARPLQTEDSQAASALAALSTLARENGIGIAVAAARTTPGVDESLRQRFGDGVVHHQGETVEQALEHALSLIRASAVRRVVLAGGPAESVVLGAALAVLREHLDAAVVWDACYADSDVGRSLALARATQAGALPYSFAALHAELVGAGATAEAPAARATARLDSAA